MFAFDGNDITLTRGDSFSLGIELKGRTFADGCEGLFTIKNTARSTEPLIEKRVPIEDNGAVIVLDPEDTKDLNFKTYYWDFRIIDLDGNVSTPMDVAAFTIAEVIGDA